MGEFDRQIATAQRLIRQKGQAVKWRVITNGAPSDPLKPWKPTQSPTVDYAVSICFLPINKETQRTLMLQAKSEVPTSNLMGLMGAVPFAPDMKDVVLRDGKELRIEAIDTLAPNGQPILYTVYFKA